MQTEEELFVNIWFHLTFIFTEEAREYIEEIERYEKEEEERFQQSLIMREERIKDIEKYVNKLTKKELKEKLS